MKKLATSLLLSSIGFAVQAAPAPKNIIMVVGDGMGPAYTTAYRLFSDDPTTPNVENTVFDRHLVGMASTHPHEVSGYVTDSAASATALATGHKTYNGAIGVDHEKNHVGSVLELAKKRGKQTGVVVTSQINHATPAGYAAHNEHRKNYNEIADSYFDNRLKGKFTLDVMLGGGTKYFIREDRNLVQEFKEQGYQYIDKLEDLPNLTLGKPTIGLFGETGLKAALDATPERLTNMVKAGIKQLEHENGYFLLVEASQIDWCGHANDIACAMGEMNEMSNTLTYLESYVKQNPDTLVVVTADHSTGGLTLAADGDYRWTPDSIKALKASPREIAKQLTTATDLKTTASDLLGIELTEDEVKTLADVEAKDEQQLEAALKYILDKRTNTGWTTGGHTAVDVQVFAMGKGKSRFHGYQDNTEIATKLMGFVEASVK